MKDLLDPLSYGMPYQAAIFLVARLDFSRGHFSTIQSTYLPTNAPNISIETLSTFFLLPLLVYCSEDGFEP